MKRLGYEQDGLSHERISEEVTWSAQYNQRKLRAWQTKTESSGEKDGDSESEKENLLVF